MRIWTSVAAGALILAGGRTIAAPPDWAGLNWLEGDWTAADAGPGQGGFSFHPDAGGRVLLRHNHADYPAQGDKPAEHHEDVMIIYHEANLDKATYWDNEGHIIHYDIDMPDADTVNFVSNDPSGPRFRLTYHRTVSGLDGSFKIAPPPARDQFKLYLHWKAVRTSP